MFKLKTCYIVKSRLSVTHAFFRDKNYAVESTTIVDRCIRVPDPADCADVELACVISAPHGGDCTVRTNVSCCSAVIDHNLS